MQVFQQRSHGKAHKALGDHAGGLRPVAAKLLLQRRRHQPRRIALVLDQLHRAVHVLFDVGGHLAAVQQAGVQQHLAGVVTAQLGNDRRGDLICRQLGDMRRTGGNIRKAQAGLFALEVQAGNVVVTVVLQHAAFNDRTGGDHPDDVPLDKAFRLGGVLYLLTDSHLIALSDQARHIALVAMEQLKNNPAGNFFLLAGPCVIEGEEMAMRIAERVVNITDTLKIPYIFKGSYRKANRSRLDSFMGIGDEKALKILKKVHDTFGVPTVTDIHSADEATMAAEYVDVLQIPAFLCRQTDILIAAAKTGKVVNIKKGQFLSPMAMQFAADKVLEAGNKEVMLTERGTTFGYQDLVVDYRGIPEMQTFGFPVILDVTHSLQQPNQTSGVTGGMPQLIETVAKAGIAVGADGLFIETHENPAIAKSDGANMLKLDLLEGLLTKLVRIREAIK